MPTTKLKAKVAVQAQPAVDAAVSQAVDEYVDALAAVRSVQKVLDRMEAARKEILALVEKTVPDEEAATLEGSTHVLTVGPKGKLRKVADPKKAVRLLRECMGDEVWGVVQIALKVLDDYLTPAQREGIIKTDPHGGRRPPIKVKER